MSLADLTRCHHEQAGRDPAATGLGNQRRVAFADESQEGINSLMSWAAVTVSKPDDIELQVLVLPLLSLCYSTCLHNGHRPTRSRRVPLVIDFHMFVLLLTVHS